MDVSFYISNKLIRGKDNKKNIASTIVLIAQIAMALGIIIALLTVSISIGFRNSIKERLAGFNGHASITDYMDNNNALENTPLLQAESLKNTLSSLKKDQELLIVKQQQTANKSGVIKTNEAYEGVIYKGFDQSMNRTVYQNYLIAGKIPHFGDLNDSVLISEKVVNGLKLKLNQPVYLYFFRDNKPVVRKFILAGIFKTDIKDIDNNYILGDLTHVRRLNRWKNGEIASIEVFFKDSNSIPQNSVFLNENIPSQYYAKSAFSLNPMLINWIDLLDVNMYVIIGIIFIVVSINITMALMILIIDRTPMIGILKSLGASNLQIQKIFLHQTVFILLKGLVIGNIIALFFIILQHYTKFIKLDADFYYVDNVPVYFNFPLFILINLVAILLSTAVLFIPTYIIAKITPIRAIKFD